MEISVVKLFKSPLERNAMGQTNLVMLEAMRDFFPLLFHIMPLKHPSYILKCDPIAAYKSDFDLNGYINLRLTVSVRKIIGVNKMSDGTKKK